MTSDELIIRAEDISLENGGNVCAAHAYVGLGLLKRNEWGENAVDRDSCTRRGLLQSELYSEINFGVFSKETLDKLNPRERAAYETLKRYFFAPVELAYGVGSVLRGKKELCEREGSLDQKIDRAVTDSCADGALVSGYSRLYPYSSALDALTGFCAGMISFVPALLAGFFYNAKK